MNERRRFLQVVGGGAVAMGMGCGTASGSGGGGAGGTADPAGSTSTGTGGDCGSGGASSHGMSADPKNCPWDLGTFDVGTPADYAKPGLYKVKNIPSNVMIGRDAGGVYAISALCTHQCCDLNDTVKGVDYGTFTTDQKKQQVIRCNCHGSEFLYDGTVVKGPASRSLAAFDLRLGCDGVLYADTSMQVPNTQRLVV